MSLIMNIIVQLELHDTATVFDRLRGKYSIVVRTWTVRNLDRGPGPEVRRFRILAVGPGPAEIFAQILRLPS